MILISMALAGSAADTLKLRDAVSCDQLGPATPVLREELIGLAESADVVPWVSVRAAGCLVERFAGDPGVVDHFAAWAGDPERAGLTLVVIDGAGALSAPDAVRVGKAALGSADARWRARFEDRLGRSSVPELRALAGVDGREGAQ